MPRHVRARHGKPRHGRPRHGRPRHGRPRYGRPRHGRARNPLVFAVNGPQHKQATKSTGPWTGEHFDHILYRQEKTIKSTGRGTVSQDTISQCMAGRGTPSERERERESQAASARPVVGDHVRPGSARNDDFCGRRMCVFQ